MRIGAPAFRHGRVACIAQNGFVALAVRATDVFMGDEIRRRQRFATVAIERRID